MSFSVFFKSLSRFLYRFFQKKKSFWFFLWLWFFFVAYSMVTVSFFIAFSLSLQKVYRFFIVASDHITPTQGKKNLCRKHAVAGQSYIDILNAGVDEYTCQILFLNTVVSCPRCLKTNSYGFKVEDIPKYSEFQLCYRNQTFSCILFLRNSYLISKFYFFMLWT